MLTGFQIEKIVEKNGIIGNILKLDELDDIQPKNGYFLLNLGNIHWTLLIIKDNECYYFDSFGRKPPVEVTSFCKNYKLKYNTKKIQKANSEYCGYYCSGLAIFVKKSSKDLFVVCKEFTSMFCTDCNNNDKVLLKFFSNSIL
jgi:hypothetical protein